MSFNKCANPHSYPQTRYRAFSSPPKVPFGPFAVNPPSPAPRQLLICFVALEIRFACSEILYSI